MMRYEYYDITVVWESLIKKCKTIIIKSSFAKSIRKRDESVVFFHPLNRESSKTHYRLKALHCFFYDFINYNMF